MNFNERIDLLSDDEVVVIIQSKEDYQNEFWELCVIEAEKRKIRGVTQIIDDLNTKIKEKEIAKKEKADKEAALLELYSEKTIIIFSSIFTPLAGSILFAMNLKRLHCKGIDYVIGIGYFYTIAVGIICFVMPFGSMSATGYLINVVAGFIMVYQFTNKYYPGDMEYKKRNPLPAYLVGFSIVMLVLLIIFRNIIY